MTEGLDGLRQRLEEYRELGARFAKWRATYSITDTLPSEYCIWTNAHALARYAALCQEAGIVPIVEPEVLQDGTHSIERSGFVTSRVLAAVYTELFDQRVDVEGTLLKPNMVLSGYEASARAGVDEVAAATLHTLSKHVPAAVPGIVFLSGGQSDEDATAHLNAMNARGPHPWQLSFSYGRALQAPALKAWGGKDGERRGRPARVLPPREDELGRAHRRVRARDGAGGVCLRHGRCLAPAVSVSPTRRARAGAPERTRLASRRRPPRTRRLLRDRGAVLRGDLAHGIVERLVGPAADHQDRARPVAGADEDVAGAGRAVEEVPPRAAGAPAPRRSACTRPRARGRPHAAPSEWYMALGSPGQTTWTLTPKPVNGSPCGSRG